MHWLSKKFNVKNPRWRTADTLERPVLRHSMSQLFDFNMAAVRHFVFLEINSRTVQRLEIRSASNFVERAHTVADIGPIAIFAFF